MHHDEKSVEMQREMREDANALDNEIREIAEMCTDYMFGESLVSAAVGSEEWFNFTSQVVHVAYNRNRITSITRNGVLEDAFDVWQDSIR